MFTQFDGGCAMPEDVNTNAAARALVACPQPPFSPPVCAGLADRIRVAAQAVQHPDPTILPGAAVSLFSVFLPVKTHRQRVNAMAFALDEQVCNRSDQTHFSLGPGSGSDRYLVAVCDDAALAAALNGTEHPGVVLPDTMGLPRPDSKRFAWNIWCENQVVYTRAADGTGFVCRADQFALFWKAADKPALYSLTGPLPAGPEVLDLSDNPPPADPEDLLLNLRHGRFQHRKKAPRRFVRFAAAAAALGILGQFCLLAADAQALSKIADERTEFVATSLARMAPEMTSDQPLRLIAARLSNNDNLQTQDPFMSILANVSQALGPQRDQITFRELRYGAREGVMTLLIQGSEFGPLQTAEAALTDAGLTVTSGTATATEGGAEVLLQIRDTP